ncbi:SurA N-terminal domain-containing protein, partial [bacterium]|nr:SurA N-terminal domain-containing protein [bacterium]
MGMMRGIRKNIKGIYWIVVVMVTVSFILWGTRIGGGGGPKYAGAVFGKKVSMKEFRRQWLAARERAIQYQHMTGRVIPADLIEALTWERIVKLREAERLGVVVTTREVKDRISNMFSTDEGFNET